MPVNSSARKLQAADGIYLDRFYEFRFKPEYLAGKHENYRYNHSGVINWLWKVLRRRPRVFDLTEANLAKLLDRLKREGFSRDRINEYRKALRAQTHFAFRLGLLPEMPACPPLPRTKSRRARYVAPGSLLDVFERLQSEQLPEASAKLLNNFRAALAAFSRHVGHAATVEDVNDATLAAMVDALIAEGIRQATAQRYERDVRRVAGWMDGGRFNDRRCLVAMPEPDPGTLRHFFETVYRPTRLLGKTSRHTEHYRSILRKLNEIAGHEVLLAELNDRLVAELMTEVLNRGRTPATANHYRALVLTIWRAAAELGKIRDFPRIKKLPEPTDAPDAWSEEELRRIIDAPASMQWPADTCGIDTAKWFRALLLTCYWTGLRRGTLFALRRSDLDLSTGWLEVPGRIMKGRRGKRFRLGADAIAAIREIWEPERELLFPLDINLKTFSKYFRRILRAAEIPPSKRRMSQMHKLRRSVATLTAAKRGIAVASELLGHQQIDVTLRYVDPSKLPGQDATQYLPELTEAAPVERSEWTPADYLREARQLFASGHYSAAAMTARVALERCLKLAFGVHNLRKPSNGSISGRVSALLQAGLLTDSQATDAKRAAKFAHKAAHGGVVDAERAEVVIACAAQLASLLTP